MDHSPWRATLVDPEAETVIIVEGPSAHAVQAIMMAFTRLSDKPWSGVVTASRVVAP